MTVSFRKACLVANVATNLGSHMVTRLYPDDSVMKSYMRAFSFVICLRPDAGMIATESFIFDGGFALDGHEFRSTRIFLHTTRRNLKGITAVRKLLRYLVYVLVDQEEVAELR